MIIKQEFSQNKNALNLGAFAGMVISFIQLIAYTFGWQESSLLQWIIYLGLIVTFSWGVRKYREMNEGFISFGQSFGFGSLYFLGSSGIYAFFNYLYVKFVIPEYIDHVLEQMEMAMYEVGYDDKMVESMMQIYNNYFGPGMYAFALLFNLMIVGILASLVISFFVRNNKPMFG